MEIISDEIIGEKRYITVKSINKLIKSEKVLEIVENIYDYVDKEGVIDKESIIEDLLEPREYKVIINKKEFGCECKSAIFNKKIECRHIKLVKEYLKQKSEGKK